MRKFGFGSALTIFSALSVLAPDSTFAAPKAAKSAAAAPTASPTLTPTPLPLKNASIVDFTVEKLTPLKKPFDLKFTETPPPKGKYNATWIHPFYGPCFGTFVLGTNKLPGSWTMRCKAGFSALGQLTTTGRNGELLGEGHTGIQKKVSFKAELE